MRDRIALLACVFAVVACGPAAPAPVTARAAATPAPTSSGDSADAPRDDVTSAVTPDPSPVALDDASRAGEAVFTRACAPCHRSGASGGSLAARHLSAQRMRAAIYSGSDREDLLPVVPPGFLSREDVAPLLVYLRAVGASP